MFTQDQYNEFWQAINTVNRCRLENGVRELGVDNSWQADVQKSRLLGRILMQGKPPLPVAPPRELAAGWYDVIDKGYAWLYGPEPEASFVHCDFTQHSIKGLWPDWPDNAFMIHGYPDWQILEDRGEAGWQLGRLTRTGGKPVPVEDETWVLAPAAIGSQLTFGDDIDFPKPDYGWYEIANQNYIEHDWLLVREV